MKFPQGINGQKFGETLNTYFIRMPGSDANGDAKISVNETLPYVSQDILLMLQKIQSIKRIDSSKIIVSKNHHTLFALAL